MGVVIGKKAKQQTTLQQMTKNGLVGILNSVSCCFLSLAIKKQQIKNRI